VALYKELVPRIFVSFNCTIRWHNTVLPMIKRREYW